MEIFSGKETQDYIDDPKNLMIYDLNTIANYDQAIIPYLEMPVGAELERGYGDTFVTINWFIKTSLTHSVPSLKQIKNSL